MAARCFSMADWNVSDGLGGAEPYPRQAARGLGEGGDGEQNPEKPDHMDLSAKTPSGSRVPAHKSTSEIHRASASSRWTICIHTGALSSRLSDAGGDLHGHHRRAAARRAGAVPAASRRGHGIEEQPRGGECGNHRVQDAQPDEDAGGRVEIACQAFGQRAGREEGVAQCGDGSADAQNHHDGETAWPPSMQGVRRFRTAPGVSPTRRSRSGRPAG